MSIVHERRRAPAVTLGRQTPRPSRRHRASLLIEPCFRGLQIVGASSWFEVPLHGVRHYYQVVGQRGGEDGDDGLVLFCVVDCDPVRGGWGQGSQGVVSFVEGRRPSVRRVSRSQGRWFQAENGARILVTSHRRGSDEEFAHLREWAPANPYLATSRAQRDAVAWDSKDPFPRPVDVRWRAEMFVVDGIETSFEVCELGDGIWAAIGRLPDVDVTMDSRGVPNTDVRLRRLAPDEKLLPRMPELGESLTAVAADLDSRFARVPFGRVRRWADYWALSGIEQEHVDHLAARYGLTDKQRERLQAHWSGRIDTELSATLERLRDHRHDMMRHRKMSRRLQWNWLYQVWFNTVGPGARTWFGNRYTTIRPHTFRLRWRP